MEFQEYKALVKSISVGKQLPDAVYIHDSALDTFPLKLAQFLSQIITHLDLNQHQWNLVKLYKRDFKLSLLNYPRFFEDAYPSLHESHTVDLVKSTVHSSNYYNSDNPPILHRKESFIKHDHQAAPIFREITQEGEQAGLYENTRSIGFKMSWERLISRKGYKLVDGRLFGKSQINYPLEESDVTFSVNRHLTAIDRNKLSKPMQMLATHSYLEGDYDVLDYGCGKGDDIRELEAHGIDVCGWEASQPGSCIQMMRRCSSRSRSQSSLMASMRSPPGMMSLIVHCSSLRQ